MAGPAPPPGGGGAAPAAAAGVYKALFDGTRAALFDVPADQSAYSAYALQWSMKQRKAWAARAYLAAYDPGRTELVNQAEVRKATIWSMLLPKELKPSDWAGRPVNERGAVLSIIERVFRECSGSAAVGDAVKAALADTVTQRAVVRLPVPWLHKCAVKGALVGGLARFALEELQALSVSIADDAVAKDELADCKALFVRATAEERNALAALERTMPTRGFRTYVLRDFPRLLRDWTDGGTHGYAASSHALQVDVPGADDPVFLPLDGGWAIVNGLGHPPVAGVQGVVAGGGVVVGVGGGGGGGGGGGVNDDDDDECFARILAAALLPAAVPCHKHYRGTNVAIGAFVNLSKCGSSGDCELGAAAVVALEQGLDAGSCSDDEAYAGSCSDDEA